MATYIVLDSIETVEAIRDSRAEDVKHFGSYTMAESYWNGLIDWDGNETEI